MKRVLTVNVLIDSAGFQATIRVMESFGDVRTTCGLETLNQYLETRSYLQGHSPSRMDAEVFSALSKAPQDTYSHVLRWYNHIKSLEIELRLSIGENPTPVKMSDHLEMNGEMNGHHDDHDDDDSKEMKMGSENENCEDDIDLFGSDSEEETFEAARVREQRLLEYAEKKSKKCAPVAKSSVLLDVKPWDDETNLEAMEEHVRSLRIDGLQWGASKLAPLAYGINKLSILCTVEDEKVSIDDLVDKICEFEDYVQSVDIAAFNKI
ncbi:Elongation factor 1-beta [Portunus trituberculatus]|uniref:Elongation factor 1-beta n=1 Tax=Portunus trituberculatus TaxID=210409 RepID=A0A5B7CD08_PORTR|nr:Elongation factor 1-beta [Portunus trituberculatus]